MTFGIQSGLGTRGAFALVLLLGLALPAQALGGSEPRVAIKGYDPVAYFTDGKPVRGSASVAFDWDESRYYFASARNRDLFAADPERYAPRFSGFCTTAILEGDRYEADPVYWSIIDGKLYVFGSQEGKESFETHPEPERAEQAWQRLR
jgi:YHS domain-containing protein